MDFDVPPEHRVKIKESENRDKYFELARELRKLRNMKVTETSFVFGALRKDPKSTGSRAGGFRNQRTSRDHPDYSIVEISQNTEKSPRDLKRLHGKTIS